MKGIAVDRYAGQPWCLVLLKDIYDSEDIERKYQVDKFTQPSGTMETVCRHIGEGRGVAHTSILNTLITNKLRKAMCATPSWLSHLPESIFKNGCFNRVKGGTHLIQVTPAGGVPLLAEESDL